jgi:hypothetical protein
MQNMSSLTSFHTQFHVSFSPTKQNGWLPDSTVGNFEWCEDIHVENASAFSMVLTPSLSLHDKDLHGSKQAEAMICVNTMNTTTTTA